MAVGLVRPTAGRALVFGQEMRPGHPVLHRVGTMIEGPGFVPHLSGLDNLRLWWRAGGRPVEDADLQGALAVAGLGEAVRRSVRTYSHGMKQRLALAQALLGRPDLLVLDEPTNGLDPQQIREVRELVAGMAAEGRTILLSSHLLAEVEQVCSHVAVMSDGKLVASGPVSEIIGADRLVYVEVSNARRGQRVLEQLLGPGSVSTDQSQPGSRGLVVSLDGMSRSELVAALVGAGVGVQTVMVRRHLEDAVLGLLEEER
jgi:ABC-2 type transport system ATP-binding protein